MSYSIIPAALIITFFIVVLFSFFTKRPLRGFALFFLLIFLVTRSGSLWVSPYGPLAWGASWIPMLFIGFLFSFLILALLPAANTKAEERQNEPIIAAGMFFWLLLIVLIISIAFGYYRSYSLIV